MYFWNTDQLVEDFRNNSLNDGDFKNYYLITAVMFIALNQLTALAPIENKIPKFVDALGTIAVQIFGITMVFKANGGKNGLSFLNKIVSLSFPLLIKLITVSVLFGFGLGMVQQMGMLNTFSREMIFEGCYIVFQWIFFLRIAHHVKKINA